MSSAQPSTAPSTTTAAVSVSKAHDSLTEDGDSATFTPVEVYTLKVVGENPNKHLLAYNKNGVPVWSVVYNRLIPLTPSDPTSAKVPSTVAMRRMKGNPPGTPPPWNYSVWHRHTQMCELHWARLPGWRAPNATKDAKDKSSATHLRSSMLQKGVFTHKHHLQLPSAPHVDKDDKAKMPFCYWKNMKSVTLADGRKVVNGIKLVPSDEGSTVYAIMLPVIGGRTDDADVAFRLYVCQTGLLPQFVEQILFSALVLMEKKHLFGNKLEQKVAGGALGVLGTAAALAKQSAGNRHGHW